MKIDYRRSVSVSDNIGAEKKECYKNCTLAYFQEHEDDKNIRYVEGLYYLPLSSGQLFPIEHAWLISGQNIIEPTLVLLDDTTEDSLLAEHYESQKVFTPEEMQKIWDAVMSGIDVYPPYSQRGIPEPKKRKRKTMSNNPYVKAARSKGFRVNASKFSLNGSRPPKAESLNTDSFKRFIDGQFDIMLSYVEKFPRDASTDSILACQNAVFVIDQLINRSLSSNVGESKTSLEKLRAEFNRWAALWKRYESVTLDFDNLA